MPSPEFGPRQVSEEAIWRFWDARKPFSGQGFAFVPTALPKTPQLVGRGLAAFSPRTPSSALGPLGLGLQPFGPRP